MLELLAFSSTIFRYFTTKMIFFLFTSLQEIYKCVSFIESVQLKKRRSQSAHEVGIYSSAHDAHLSDEASHQQCCPLVTSDGNGTNSKVSPDIIVTHMESELKCDVTEHVTQSAQNLECLESVTENDDPNVATSSSSFRSLLNRLQSSTRRRPGD